MPGVARTSKDTAARLLKSSPQSSVIVNDQFLAAVEGTIDAHGDMIVASDVTVYVEDKKIAVQGAVTAAGATVGVASQNVFAGNGK